MRIRQRYLWFVLASALAATALAFLLGSGLKSAHAQGTGALVVFIVPAGTPITNGADVLIYVAQPSGSTQAVGCAADQQAYPIQSDVITDPSGGRATRISGTITISQTSPVANGTRVGSLTSAGQCITNGAAWDKYSGMVQ